jgi:hypothetical protein
MTNPLNSIQVASIFRTLASFSTRIGKIEGMLQGQTIPTVRITDAAITNAKIANLAVDTAKIANLSVTEGKIGNLAVTTAKIDNLAVTDAKIANITWDKGQGGSLKLGGASNVNGILQIYDNSNVLKGTWDKDGINVLSGSLTGAIITGGTIRTAASGARVELNGSSKQIEVYNGSNLRGHIYYYNYDGQDNIVIAGENGGQIILAPTNYVQVFDSDLRIDNDLKVATIRGKNGSGDVRIRVTGASNAALWADDSDNSITVQKFFIGASEKTAIVKTSKGYNALYCMESPEVWFMDFCDNKKKIDPLFMEVTEGEMKFIKLTGKGYQVWRRRKGFINKRFDKKTKTQYLKNNKFWSTPLR